MSINNKNQRDCMTAPSSKLLFKTTSKALNAEPVKLRWLTTQASYWAKMTRCLIKSTQRENRTHSPSGKLKLWNVWIKEFSKSQSAPRLKLSAHRLWVSARLRSQTCLLTLIYCMMLLYLLANKMSSLSWTRLKFNSWLKSKQWMR